MTDSYNSRQERTSEDPSDKTDPLAEPSVKDQKSGSRKRARRQGRHQSTRQEDSQARSKAAAAAASGTSATHAASSASAAASATTAPAASAVQISAPDLSGFDVFCDDYRYSNDDFSWDFYDDRSSAAGQPGQTPFAASDATRPLQRASSSDKTASLSTAATQTAAMPKAAQPAATAPCAAASSTVQMPSVPSPDRQGQQISPTEPFPTVAPTATVKAAPAEEEDEGSPHHFGHALRWIFRIAMLGVLVFGFATIWYLTEQTTDETSELSSAVEALAEQGAGAFESGSIPAFEDDPVRWAAYAILYISAKLISHGLSIRQQAHIVEFALLGGIIALNVLAWFSGTRHRHTILMALGSIALCACASFLDQYHKLYVPGREFDVTDLMLDALGYICAVLVVVTIWRIGSCIYRTIAKKRKAS